jgi:hypothetical protein
MGWVPKDGAPIRINGSYNVSTNVIRFVVASAAEAELGALFHNCQTGIIFRSILKDMGHPQPRTLVHCDNATAVSIANQTFKRQWSRSMEMRFFWVSDKCAQDMYSLHWHPGQENLADYQSKHHAGTHHTKVRPWYLHEPNSPRELPRALRPSALKGCVGTLAGGYLNKVPLPRAPLLQSSFLMTSESPRETIDTCYLQVQRIPTWSDLVRSLLGAIRSTILPLAPRWFM